MESVGGAYRIIISNTLCSCYMCSIWDIEQGLKVTSLQDNCTYSTARITAAEFINPHDISFLLVGSGNESLLIIY